MSDVTFQTAKLERGRHQSPEDGVCVMELASMLAGEPFSDHPRSVSHTIASFLRVYNDRLDDARRSDLYTYAAEVVDTAAPPMVEGERLRRLIGWGDAHWESGRRGVLRAIRRRRAARHRHRDTVQAGHYAVASIPKIDDRTHAAALALVDELMAIGRVSRERAEEIVQAVLPGWVFDPDFRYTEVDELCFTEVDELRFTEVDELRFTEVDELRFTEVDELRFTEADELDPAELPSWEFDLAFAC
jgi:hypothetical protein